MRKPDRVVVGFAVLVLACVMSQCAMWWMFAENSRLRAQLAHYREVTHTTPELCVEAEVAP